jgi:hypothetical protein
LTRPQVAWLLFVSQVISALFIKGNRSRIVFICALLIAACGGYFLTTSVITETRSTFGAKPAIGSKGSDSASAAKLCEYIGEQVLIGSNKYDCFLEKTEIEKIRTSTPVETLTNNVEVLPQIQEVRAIGAESAIQQISCPFSSDSITSKYICVAWNAPYMSLTFLFRPLLFVDTTSTSSTYAALENMFWMSIFLIFCYGIVRRREKYLIVQLYPLYLFMVLYVVGAGSYQGNMGTAFRHKSLLVSGFLLLFYLAYQKTIQDRDVLSTHSPKPSPEIS